VGIFNFARNRLFVLNVWNARVIIISNIKKSNQLVEWLLTHHQVGRFAMKQPPYDNVTHGRQPWLRRTLFTLNPPLTQHRKMMTGNRLWRGVLRTYGLRMISLGRSTYLIPGGFARVVEDLETLY
jgi:hypothetical protein